MLRLRKWFLLPKVRRYLTCTLPNVPYPRTSSRSYMSKTSVLWLTIDSHVLLPCRRTPFLCLTISRLLFVSMSRSCLGLREYSSKRGKIVSFLSARRSCWARREKSSERGKKSNSGAKKQKSKRPRSFLRFLLSLIFILLGNLSFFSDICGVGSKYIDNTRGHVLVVI